jgi:hypothetical protein
MYSKYESHRLFYILVVFTTSAGIFNAAVYYKSKFPPPYIFKLRQLSQYSVWLQTGRPVFNPRQRQRIVSSSLCVKTSPEANPASYPMGTGGLCPEVKRGQGVTLTTHLHLVPEVKTEKERHILSSFAPAWRSGTAFYILIFYNNMWLVPTYSDCFLIF